jgi:hypothetical protein
MKPLVLILASLLFVGIPLCAGVAYLLTRGNAPAQATVAEPAEPRPTLLANSFCVSMPTSDLQFGQNTGITSER